MLDETELMNVKRDAIALVSSIDKAQATSRTIPSKYERRVLKKLRSSDWAWIMDFILFGDPKPVREFIKHQLGWADDV